MLCSKCGTKNEEGAKFCASCGNKLEPTENKKSSKPKNKSSLKDKIKKIPKKVKIGIGVAFLLIIITIITLTILLSNPVKKVEDYLASYYNNYKENYKNDELIKIGDILRNNKGKEDTLESISKQIEKTLNNWVKNFNKSYKDQEELKIKYTKIYNILSEIYSYFNVLEYVLTYEDYYKYCDELRSLYTSKENYFKAQEANNDADKYSYYNLVIEDDSYYKEAKEFVSNYLKDEIEELESKIKELTNFKEDTKTEEKLNAYIEVVEYLKNNKNKDSIDLSTTEEYITLYEDATNKVVEYTKSLAEELDKNLKTNEVMEMINKSMKVLDRDSDTYKELEELKENYEEKLPDNLTDKYLVSSTSGSNDSSYKITIHDQEYDSYISFSFKGKTVSRVYRLNNEYKTFKTTIVKGTDWDADFKGEIIIYGDGKELYRSGEITKTNEIKTEINIDVTDVDDLKIEFITKSEPDGWANFYIYLVEPYLYK